MKFVSNRLAVAFLSVFLCFCASCGGPEAASVQPQPKLSAAAPRPSDIVAQIDNVQITRQQLIQGFAAELRPDPFAPAAGTQPPNAEQVLLKMVAEKAMAVEGRKLDYLQDPGIRRQIKRFKEKQLMNMVLSANLTEDRLAVTDDEIQQKMRENPRFDRNRAQAMLGRDKANKVIQELQVRLTEKFHLRKQRENLPKAARIYQRLLASSKSPYQMKFVGLKQIENELTDQEKSIVLATYDGGQVTLLDWFDSLHEMSPPSRPRDLNTIRGFETFLDQRVLKTPLLMAEAYANGFDKDPDYLQQLRQREDTLLTSKVIMEQIPKSGEPSPEQIITYFNDHKTRFMSPPNLLKIDQLWCADFDTAREVVAQLQGGVDFDSLRSRFSIAEAAEPTTATPESEILFDTLWAAELNQIVGPQKLLYADKISYRIVKILEKTPGQVRQYSPDLDQDIKSRIRTQQSKAKLDEYRAQLLKQYQYQIYRDRFADLMDLP